MPSVNTVIEPELTRWCPTGVSVHGVRLKRGGADTVEEIEKMNRGIEEAATLLKDARVNIVLYGCTGGSFYKGKDSDSEITKRVEAIVDIPVITASRAIKELLIANSIKKIAVATPYPQNLDDLLTQYLLGAGIEVVEVKGLGMASQDVGDLPSYASYRLARQLELGEAEAILISCTNFPSLETIPSLQRDTGLPVISSNSALMLSALATLGIDAEGSMPQEIAARWQVSKWRT
jgi:maleate isomerase